MSRLLALLCLLLVTVLAPAGPVRAHALEPGYLELTPVGADGWRVFWRRPDVNGRPMAMVALRIETESREHGEAEPGRRALHQAARLINRVTRAEDLAARVASDTFLVLLPATTEKNAEKAALRIQGVLENTVFRSASDDLLYGVHVETAACARTEGLCIEECVALALAVLRENAEAAVTIIN